MPSAFDRETSLGHLLHLAARQSARRLEVRLAPTGLRPAQLSVLLELAGSDGLTQRNLHERLSVEQATMAQTLARLKRDGWAAPGPHEHDRRASRWWLTDAGRAVLPAARRAAAAANREALTRLAAQDRDRLVLLLQQLVERPE
jgi:DNA-binding MarR family transcriptional regulator